MEDLVNPKEKQYFVIALIISIVIYLLLIVSIIGAVYLIFGAICFLFMQGLFIGNLKGNGIRISENQFPDVYRLTKELSEKIGLDSVPSVYIIQAGGLLNAFATRFLSRDFVVIYSDVFELAYEKGESALAFVIGHELGHLKRKHITKRIYVLPVMCIPFFGVAYSRACEYTCDRFGANVCPEGAANGLMVLAAGKKLYQEVNQEEYLRQINTEDGFWVWFSEKLASHPNLPKRLRALTMQNINLSSDGTGLQG